MVSWVGSDDAIAGIGVSVDVRTGVKVTVEVGKGVKVSVGIMGLVGVSLAIGTQEVRIMTRNTPIILGFIFFLSTNFQE